MGGTPLILSHCIHFLALPDPSVRSRPRPAPLQLFETHKEAPPLSKNQPPLAGAINWSHSLFLRIRQTIAKFQSLDEEMFNSEQGQMISQKFVQVSKAIRRFEKGKFEEWKETVNSKAMLLLKQPIFRAEGSAILVNFDQALVVLDRLRGVGDAASASTRRGQSPS